jgi:hypothetical protein
LQTNELFGRLAIALPGLGLTLLSGTIIRGTPKTPKSQLVTPKTPKSQLVTPKTSDDGLRLARPPGLELYLDLGRRSPPRPTPRLGLYLDLGRRSPPRPTPRLGLDLDLGRRSPPRSPPRRSDSTSSSDDGLRLARPLGSDSTSTSDDRLRLARPPGPNSASTSEDPPPRPTSGSDRPRHRGAIITLPLASSGYGEQDRRPIWLASVNK